MIQEHLEKLLDSGFKLIAFETDTLEQTLSDFRSLTREGKAIYVWQDLAGLQRMEASHITIPNTMEPVDVLKYINNSNLYGIYLLTGFSELLSDWEIQDQLKTYTDTLQESKIVILIDEEFNLPHNLLEHILLTQEYQLRALRELKQIA